MGSQLDTTHSPGLSLAMMLFPPIIEVSVLAAFETVLSNGAEGGTAGRLTESVTAGWGGGGGVNLCVGGVCLCNGGGGVPLCTCEGGVIPCTGGGGGVIRGACSCDMRGGGGGGAVGAGGVGAFCVGVVPSVKNTDCPQLAQNFCPGMSGVPQFLQNAILFTVFVI